MAQAFGVIPVSVWRWAKALAGGGVAGLVPAAKGPQRASKLTPQVVARIRELDRHGAGKAAIAAATGVSESSVRSVLRPARPAAGRPARIPADQDPADTDTAARTSRTQRERTGAGGAAGAAGSGAQGRGAGAGPVRAAGRGRRAGVHAGRALPAGRAAARAAAAGAPGCWPARGRCTGGSATGSTAWSHAGRAGVHGAAARGPRRGRHPDPAGRAGPGAGPGPGPGSQDDPPQARRARRRRQGRAAAAGAGPPPRRGQPGHPGVPLHRRAHPGLLRQAGHPEDAPGQAEVPRPGDRGDLGHRQRRGPAAGRDGPAVILPGRPDPRPAARAARHRRARRQAGPVLRPRRLVPGPVRRTSPTPGSTC